MMIDELFDLSLTILWNRIIRDKFHLNFIFSRIRKDNAPQNFAVLRHIAVNLLGQEKSKKLGAKNKQFLAAMDDSYLANILELSI